MQDRYSREVGVMVRGESPRGLTAMGIFLFFGAVMASLAGTSLLWRGAVLDRMWVLNPAAYRQLAPFGRGIGVVFLALGATLAIAGTGWLRRRMWGWRLAVVVIASQVLGDLLNAFLDHFVRGAIGAVIAGALLFYLLRPGVRGVFEGGAVASARN